MVTPLVVLAIEPSGIVSSEMDRNIVVGASFLGGVINRGFRCTTGARAVDCGSALAASLSLGTHILVTDGGTSFLNMLADEGVGGSIISAGGIEEVA